MKLRPYYLIAVGARCWNLQAVNESPVDLVGTWKRDEKLTIREWTSKPLRSCNKDILRGVAFQGVLRACWGLC